LIQRAVILAVIAASLWFGWRWMFPDDEAQIKAVLARIAEGLGGDTGSNGEVGRIARAASLRNEFAPDVTIDAGAPLQRLTGRDSIIGAAARMNSTVRNLEIQFPDVSVHVDPDRQTATATVTAEARFEDRAGIRVIDARELEVGFKRIDGNWVISAVTVMRPLERLDGR
jgi:hypothetical protein